MRGISGPCFFKRKWQCMIVIRQPRFNLLSRCIASLSKPVDQIRQVERTRSISFPERCTDRGIKFRICFPAYGRTVGLQIACRRRYHRKIFNGANRYTTGRSNAFGRILQNPFVQGFIVLQLQPMPRSGDIPFLKTQVVSLDNDFFPGLIRLEYRYFSQVLFLGSNMNQRPVFQFPEFRCKRSAQQITCSQCFGNQQG